MPPAWDPRRREDVAPIAGAGDHRFISGAAGRARRGFTALPDGLLAELGLA